MDNQKYGILKLFFQDKTTMELLKVFLDILNEMIGHKKQNFQNIERSEGQKKFLMETMFLSNQVDGGSLCRDPSKILSRLKQQITSE